MSFNVGDKIERFCHGDGEWFIEEIISVNTDTIQTRDLLHIVETISISNTKIAPLNTNCINIIECAPFATETQYYPKPIYHHDRNVVLISTFNENDQLQLNQYDIDQDRFQIISTCTLSPDLFTNSPQSYDHALDEQNNIYYAIDMCVNIVKFDINNSQWMYVGNYYRLLHSYSNAANYVTSLSRLQYVSNESTTKQLMHALHKHTPLYASICQVIAEMCTGSHLLLVTDNVQAALYTKQNRFVKLLSFSEPISTIWDTVSVPELQKTIIIHAKIYDEWNDNFDCVVMKNQIHVYLPDSDDLWVGCVVMFSHYLFIFVDDNSDSKEYEGIYVVDLLRNYHSTYKYDGTKKIPYLTCFIEGLAG
eukprot:240734_1